MQLSDVNDPNLLHCARAEPLSYRKRPHALINPSIKVVIKEDIAVSIETTRKSP